MEIQHFSHNHPLVFIEDHQQSHEGDRAYCSGCEEVIEGPRFTCVACGFHLDKICAEAATKISHLFHSHQSLNLLQTPPNASGMPIICNICGKDCKKFVYFCSCGVILHIKCALFSCIIVEKTIGGQLGYKDLSICTENLSEELKEAKCFVCRKSLLDSAYLSPDFGFYLHKKCIELPLEIHHPFHRPHSLSLQINNVPYHPCDMCREIQPRGLVYGCSICNFVFHIECASLSLPTFEDTSSHEHQFTRLWLRQSSFTCDACGSSGGSVSYICSTCSLIVHKKCISLPRIVKSRLHHHPMFHKYFVADNEAGTLECAFCYEKVNKECGSYYCSDCKFILHVNCALQDTRWCYKIESKDDYENALVVDTGDPPFLVIKDGENVMNTEIRHFSHQHKLVSTEVVKNVDRYCDCCSILITTSFYLCFQCNFSLHKSCAELPRKKQIWIHFHQLPLTLIPNCFFQCSFCHHQCTGFAYKCMEYLCGTLCCVRCAGLSLVCASQGHRHLLHSYFKVGPKYCNACGVSTGGFPIYRCRGCDFNVHRKCIYLPQKARHKCDEHLLILTYHDDNDYSKHHYCDICEEKRNTNIWFYHCAICDTSAHTECVFGGFPFIKLGTTRLLEAHPHPLVLVKKDYEYPECCKLCGKPCSDLALECAETRCNYIIHYKKCVG